MREIATPEWRKVNVFDESGHRRSCDWRSKCVGEMGIHFLRNGYRVKLPLYLLVSRLVAFIFAIVCVKNPNRDIRNSVGILFIYLPRFVL